MCCSGMCTVRRAPVLEGDLAPELSHRGECMRTGAEPVPQGPGARSRLCCPVCPSWRAPLGPRSAGASLPGVLSEHWPMECSILASTAPRIRIT